MLYDRWRQIARAHAREPALWDPASDRWWTFAELARAADAASGTTGPLAFPQGAGIDFVLTTLRAWREGRVVCPLEPNQPRPEVPPPPTGIAHLKTTSATTGTPRLVAFREEQLAADADNIVATMGLRPEWPNLALISLAHSYGFSNLILPLLLHGIPLIVSDSALPEAVRRRASLVGALTLPAVPALWRAWIDAGTIPTQTRLAISAGAPLPLALEQQVFASAGVKIHNFYGSSECGGIAYDATPTPRTESSLAGTPMVNVQLAVGDDACLEVRGAAVAATYWPEPAPSLSGGCYRTRDLAEIRNGRVHLLGRASDIINVAGRKVCPEGVEAVLLRHPDVAECLVLGVPAGDVREEVVAAVVVPRGRVTAEILRDHLLAVLPAWQVPREWRFVDQLGANERGKLSRAEWRRRFPGINCASQTPAS